MRWRFSPHRRVYYNFKLKGCTSCRIRWDVSRNLRWSKTWTPRTILPTWCSPNWCYKKMIVRGLSVPSSRCCWRNRIHTVRWPRWSIGIAARINFKKLNPWSIGPPSMHPTPMNLVYVSVEDCSTSGVWNHVKPSLNSMWPSGTNNTPKIVSHTWLISTSTPSWISTTPWWKRVPGRLTQRTWERAIWSSRSWVCEDLNKGIHFLF